MALTISSEDCRNSPNPTDHSQMANSSWNIGEVIALSLGLVLVFALYFGFRIWWGRRRDKRRKQREREGAGDVEASPPPDSEAQNSGRPKRYDGQGLVLIPFPPENSRILGTRRDGGRGDDGGGQGAGNIGGQAEGAHVESGHAGGVAGGDGGGGGGNCGAGGTN